MQLFLKSRFQLLQKTSPKSATKLALKLWSTVPKYKPSFQEKLLIESAGRKRIPFQESKYQPSRNTYYTLYSWGKGPSVLLVHDWGGCGAQMASLAQPLVKAGYQVITFDALAHGDSPGKQTDLSEIVGIIKDIETKFNGFHAIIAHSYGALAAGIALQDGVKANKLVVCSAATALDFYLRKFSKKLNASREMRGRIIVNVTNRLGLNIEKLSLVHIAARLNRPVLILHDQNDEVVDHREALALSNCWPGSQLVMTSGLGHFGILKDSKTIQKIQQYIGFPQKVLTESAA
ncbi:alpha/beta hydrolase [candidate division KSB1 bacterium]|nr:alpha/beta hydrolase [candidate division KSB1 bacterium]